MNSDELKGVLSRTLPKDVFIGVFDASSFPVAEKLPYCFVLHSQPMCKTEGHWVSCYVNSDRMPYYFDPLGEYPYYSKWVHFLAASSQNGFWDYNRIRVQPLTSTNCGQYNIFYLVNRYFLPNSVSNYDIISKCSDKIVDDFYREIVGK